MTIYSERLICFSLQYTVAYLVSLFGRKFYFLEMRYQRYVIWNHREHCIAETRQTAITAYGILYLRQKDFNNQKTRDVDPMTGYLWFNVCDAVLTLNQHWFNVSCLLGYYHCHNVI